MKLKLLNLLVLSSTVLGISLTSCSNEEEKPKIEDVDVVTETKLNISDELFTKVMAQKANSNFDSNLLDFERDGIERVNTNFNYAPNKAGDVFTNYVDADTTHFNTYNGIYSVKVRYLGIDTPESTSEVEEWGKTASNYNKSILSEAKHIIIQSQSANLESANNQDLNGDGIIGTSAADIDNYHRALAFVWYSNEDVPTKDSFRNLNLEIAYQGYGLAKVSDNMGSTLQDAFFKAGDIAEAYERGIWSNEKDPNFCYDKPQDLSLDMLYDEAYNVYNEEYEKNLSMFCDRKTLYSVEGVITRVSGTSFYIQDEIDGTPYGLYVFTFKRYAPIKVGNRVKVRGVISYYGGNYQMQGLTYDRFNQDPDRDIVLVSKNNPVVPIKATAQEIASGKYKSCLVEVVDENDQPVDIYFKELINETYNSDYNYGGVQELNQYNATHPFYNTDNGMTLLAKSKEDWKANENYNTAINGSNFLRIDISQDVAITSTTADLNQQVIQSYKYFTGQDSQFCAGNPDFQTDGTPESEIITYNFTRKKINGLVGISQNYLSVSGKSQKYTVAVCTPEDIGTITSLE